jgi:preprotein translocase subunit SecG
MTLLITTLIIIACILLILVIMVQNPKGGGLSSTFGGGNPQIFGGVKKTTDFLDRGTWVLAIALVVLVMASNIAVSTSSTDGDIPESSLNDELDGFSAPVPQTIPINNDEELGDALPEAIEE